MENIIREIETAYPVETITADGEQVWPYLRVHYAFGHRAKALSEEQERDSYISPALVRRLGLGLKLGASTLYGARNWFRRYDYVALSATNCRRPVDGTYFNIFLDPLIDEIGADRVLLMESAPPLPSLYPIRQVHTRNVVSSHGLLLVPRLAQATVRTPHIENLSVLRAIQRQYGLRIPDMRLIRRFKTARRLYRRVLRRLRPRGMLLTCYYGREAAIKAAHDLGIEVIEVQHGTIGKEHPAYTVHADLDKGCFPDHLLVFGRKELETFDNPRFIDPDQVYPVGSFYIGHVRSTFTPDPALSALLRPYKHTVGVTLQVGAERRLLDFISRAAALDTSICYVIIPRLHDAYLRGLSLPRNVMVVTAHNFYQMMMYVDFHSTIYSTCALEAPSLGVQNVLVNIDNLSKTYYGDVLSDSQITRYVETPDEYVEAIRTFPRLDSETLCRANEHIIATGYRQNIRAFVKDHLR